MRARLVYQKDTQYRQRCGTLERRGTPRDQRLLEKIQTHTYMEK